MQICFLDEILGISCPHKVFHVVMVLSNNEPGTVQIAIEPKTKGDQEKMSNGLYKLAQEDPSFHYSRDDETNQTVIEGMGELHLDIIVDRLKREFKVEANIGAPQVNYREALTSPAGEPVKRWCMALVSGGL